MTGDAPQALINFDLIGPGQDETAFEYVRPKKDSEATKAAILTAAMFEYSEYGVSGARIDRIAKRAKANKSLIYSYFGDKEELYALVLRSAYVQIRNAERGLDLTSLEPIAAVKEFISFTLDHFLKSPWFFRLLAEENLRRGETIQKMDDISDLQSPLLDVIGEVIRKGREEGVFLRDISAPNLYLLIASLFFFPLSNRYTLKSVFEVETGTPEWREIALKQAQDVVVAYLKSPEE